MPNGRRNETNAARQQKPGILRVLFDAGAKDPTPPGNSSRSKFSTEAPESREVAQHFFSRIASQTIFRFGANV
ncbi:MAG: hypothetical protein A4S17_07065 [Proteobacteria bacterium HN_bin10]|nr:MAG: hypothetical protein A4S17_07065 [Proteobacteria bacterium HN_bin10]